MQLGAALAGRPDQHHGKAGVEGHRHECRLAEARHALDADLLRVDARVALEIVERARRSPGPRAECAPVVGLARSSVVDEADDPRRQSGAVVCLDAGGIQRHVAPAGRDQLFRRGRVRARGRRRGRTGGTRRPATRSTGIREARQTGQSAAAEHDQDRHRSPHIRGRDDDHLDVDGHGGIRAVVHVSDQLTSEHRVTSYGGLGRREHGPRDTRDSRRHAPDDLSLEVLHDLGSSLLPPVVSARDRAPVLQRQHRGQLRERIGQRLVVVRCVRGFRVSARPRPKRLDPELLEHVPMVCLRRPLVLPDRWRSGRGGLGRRLATDDGGQNRRDENERPGSATRCTPEVAHGCFRTMDGQRSEFWITARLKAGTTRCISAGRLQPPAASRQPPAASRRPLAFSPWPLLRPAMRLFLLQARDPDA